MTRASFDAIVGPKLDGARHLDRLLRELDLFVLFSSTSAFLAQAGQANYAAANAGLDALAHDRRGRGLPALSIGWGVWEGTGLVKGEAGAQNLREMARQGIHGFSPERATALFSRLVAGSQHPALAVLPVDWAGYRGARRGRVEPIFRSLTAGAGGTGPEGDPREPVAQASPARRRQLVEGVVRDSLSRVLKIAPARIDARAAFGSMGLNSLLAMELRNRLEAALGRSLSATLAFNYPTLAALVDHLAGDAGAATPTKPTLPPDGAAPPTVALEDIAQLTDDEAALALRSRPSRGTA
jgi:myxalamid-type polyketide synthase MxaE and MxaD